MRGLRRVYTCIWSFLFPILAFGTSLQRSDIPKIMERFFSYHIEQKQMSTKIMRRSLKLYIEQFDPEKIYLLSSEVRPFLQISEKKLQEAVNEYYKGNFPLFEEIHGICTNAIFRAQNIRKTWQIDNPSIKKREHLKEEFVGYPANEKEIYTRQKKKMYRFFSYVQKNIPEANERTLDKAQQFFEKKVRQFELSYLFINNEGRALNEREKENIFTEKILKSIAKSLDAHTAFFSEDEAYEMRMSLEKQFEGVGIVLTEGIEGVIVADIIEGSPADKSQKIHKNDRIVKINGQSVKGMSFEDILRLMKAKDHSVLKLSLIPASNPKSPELNIELSKGPITMDSERLTLEAEPFGDGYIAKLNLKSFYENGKGINSEKDIKDAVSALAKKGTIYGIVLDLRDNAGGFLSQAVKVAGLFISSGVVVISKYAEGDLHYLRKVDVNSFYKGPLIVLTSKLSASAAEIVAAALQDYGAAIIVGDERTFGKGSIQFQTVTDKNADLFFKVTVGKYYTVSGKSTQVEGVLADIVVPSVFSPLQIGERFLEYPLAPDQVAAAYQDPLSDLDPQSKIWFQKNYLPFLQKKITYWKKMLPDLSENAKYRMKNNPDFQIFLDSLQNPYAFTSPSQLTKDYQLEQALEILKDMIYLESSNQVAAEKAFSKKKYAEK